jgi:uncharacterized protein (DUF885 family)
MAITLSFLLNSAAMAVGVTGAETISPDGKQLMPSAQDNEFTGAVDAYFNQRFKDEPSWATAQGVHDYDNVLEDFSQAAFDRHAGEEQNWLDKFEHIDESRLSKVNKLDRALLMSDINSRLLALNDTQMWRKNPDYYSSRVTSSIFDLIKREFAPLDVRMQSVIAREKAIPAALDAGIKNLQPNLIPPVYADINLEQLPGVIDFYVTSVPLAFKDVKDASLQERLKSANEAVISALKQYEKHVRHLVEKKECTGAFALGEKNFSRKLLYEEMVDEPLDKLLADGYAELHKQQKQFVQLAHQVSNDSSVDAYFKSISRDHPSADKLLPSVSGVLEEIRSFCIEHNIVTIPSEERAKVEETPPFDRALTFASMDTPGPYESKARQAYYYVTLPEPGWSAEKTEEHLRSYSYGDLINTSVHEAYPGHYVQFLWSKQFPTKVRKLIGCNTNEEGWAHYCEQMMLDEGLRRGDSSLRMVQLHDALLRCCRYIVGIQMHTKGMTVDEGIAFFMKEGYMERANAERETRRGTMDPTYLYYTLGKMQILALRDDYKKMAGAHYSIKQFHDDFLGCGFPPIRIVRADLLNQPLTEEASKGDNHN